MASRFTTHSAKARHSIERSSALVASLHGPFSEASITDIAELDPFGIPDEVLGTHKKCLVWFDES
jgi:hypothetical protein